MRILSRWLLSVICLVMLPTLAMGGSWTTNKFYYKPSLGARGQVEKTQFDTAIDQVDARLGKEIWVGDPLHLTLDSILTDVTVTSGTIVVPDGTHTLNSSLDRTLAAGLNLRVLSGGIISIPTGRTLTITGTVDAGPRQIFSCTGTGAVAITNKGQPSHSDWFGTSLQKAVDATPAGGKLILGANTYTLSTSLNIAQDDVSVEGQDDKTILVTPSSGSVDAVYITGDRVTFKNLKITPTGTYQGSLVHAYQAPNIRISGLFLDGSAATAVYGFSLWVEQSDNYLVKENRIISRNGTINYGFNNIQVQDSADGTIEKNLIDGGRQYGINVKSISGLSTGARIISNTVKNTSYVGIISSNGYASIIGNRVTDCGSAGIFLTGDTGGGTTNNGSVIIGNTISGITGLASAIDAEWDVHFFSILGNTIISPANNGISAIRNVTDGVIAGNTISSPGKDGISLTIYGSSPNARIVVESNIVSNAVRYGLYTDDTSGGGLKFTNNIVSGSGTTNGAFALGTYSFGNTGIDGEISNYLTGTVTWNPPSVNDGAMTSTTVTVTGARVGNPVLVGFSQAVPAGAILSGAVTTNDTVTVTLFNKTGGALDLASGTLRVDVWKH